VVDFSPSALAAGSAFSLYVHLPFCRSKCPYCDFFSVPCSSGAEIEGVVNGILGELQLFRERLAPSGVPTVYIGGGTPSLLPEGTLRRLLAGVRAFANRPMEWTVEANPESLTPAFLEVCAEEGPDRLSLGVQSLKEELLRVLGRPGDAAANRRALERVHASWEKRLSLDFLVGVPGQSRSDLLRDLRGASESGAEHISLYSLTPPEGSPLAQAIVRETQEELWLAGFEWLETHGYPNYEIANFAVPGKECLHNLRYWSLEPYLGVGPGAVSTLPGRRGEVFRLYHAESIPTFLGGNPWGIRVEEITPREFLFETLMMGFRMREGLSSELFQGRFGQPLPDLLPGLWRRWQDRGYLRETPGRYAFTDKARMFLNQRLVEAQEALGELAEPTVSWPPAAETPPRNSDAAPRDESGVAESDIG
jgi:oxygen-independent coproporphyrinogen-3 oxidase